MSRIRLIHWKRAEAVHYLNTLNKAGHVAEYDEEFRPALMRSWRESPPDAFVIDLSRLPSHGREIAIALRQSPATRHVPMVFCEGAEEKVNRTRRDLPDAAYCSLTNLRGTLRQALAKPPVEPVKPIQMMERYGSRTTAEKLGIKQRSTLSLLHAPREGARILGELPRDVKIHDDSAQEDSAAPIASVTLCFVEEPDTLQNRLSTVRHCAAQSKLWILWRKGGSAARGDVTEFLVRETALKLGLVDYKICSVDRVWSAMLFALKRS